MNFFFFFATAFPAESGQTAINIPSGQPEQLVQTIARLSGSSLNLSIDITTIATVGIVLAFSYSIIKSFREKT